MNANPENMKVGNRKLSMLKRILLIGISAIIVAIILALILAPGLATNYINKNGKELAGRKVHIDKMELNYFTSTINVIGFKFFENNDSTVFMRFDTLMVNMKPLKLLSDEIYIEQLQLINPSGNIIQNDTIFNFSDLLDFFTTDSVGAEETSDTIPEKSYKLNLNLLEIKNGFFNYTDKTINHTMVLKEVSFVIPQIIWSKLDSSKADVSFNLGKSGSFASSMNYNIENGNFSGYAKIKDLEMATFLPYVKQYMKVSEIDGTFTSDLYFSGKDSDIEDVSVRGVFQVDNFKMKDNKNKEVLGGISYRAVLSASKPMKYEAIIDTVLLDKPYMYLALEDSLFNFEKMLVESPPETASSETAEEEIPMNVVLNRFIINDGLMDFSDQTMREEFNYELSKMTVNMDTFSLQDEWVNINANMKLNKRGTLEAKLGVNPLDPMKKIDLDYVLTDFQLPDINIYSKHYAGLPILFGDMYYVNKTRILNNQLTSDNKLIIRNVEMGRKTGGLYDVPIKLVLFILKDINGDIILDIPVKGDLSDPKTRIAPIVWATFKSFMFKIAVSPFRALGGLLGADPKELEEITFDYGDTTLVAKQTRSFDLLLDLERKKPELQIDLHYLNDRKLEKFDAASQLANQFFFKKSGKKANANNKEYLQFLMDETGKDSLTMQDYELLVTPAAMIDSVLQQREKIRLDLTRKYFTGKNDSTTIRIMGYDKDDVLNIGSRPRFEVRYVLAEDAEKK
jgi:hypothetical protein